MPAFDRERPEVNTEYRPPEGTPVERIEVPIVTQDLTPSLREALGFTVVEPKLFKVEVRGGVWTHYSETEAERSGYDGHYDTRFVEEQGTLYGVYLNNRVNIVRPRPVTKFSLLDKSKSPSISEMTDILSRPSGIGAKVELEPVEGTDLTVPVLRYTEVRPQRFSLPIISNTNQPEAVKTPLILMNKPQVNLLNIKNFRIFRPSTQ